ncbi:MAG: hypothetical protein NC548_13000 [Lachnospiraceae bacterium]|nr:hypothetical protein [Lachnospiraceae bacterium]MCM1230692.1 hypothetical protein [Ruminococcus flavefaciens]
MKIEHVYRDSHGTVWMYASCDHPNRTNHNPQRRRRRRKKHYNVRNRALLGVVTFVLLLVIANIICIANAQKVEDNSDDIMNAGHAANINVTKSDKISVTPEFKPLNEIIQLPEDEEEIPEDPVEEEVVEPTIQECIGQASFTIGSSTFTSLDLPDTYYPGIDFSSFQPYEDYSVITNKRSAAYSITRSDRAYNDENGLRRYDLTEDQFSIDGKDDYVIALGTFYKPKGTCGQRYLIVTSTGYYTAIAGDEKADEHTDDMHMFTLHCNGEVAGIVEWLVDTDTLNSSMRRSGNIATQKGPVEELKGEILYIYLIEE